MSRIVDNHGPLVKESRQDFTNRCDCVCGHPQVAHDGECCWRFCACPEFLAVQWQEPREGMLTVYDHEGRYRGCIGRASWDILLAEGEANGL